MRALSYVSWVPGGVADAGSPQDIALHLQVDRARVPIRDLQPVHLQVEGARCGDRRSAVEVVTAR
jgi:hypothetical protein